MTTVTTVPFSKLVASDTINARAATKEGLDELAASIATKGLIQPLAVRPADGDKFEVIDGRRRHQAIARLVKAKSWKKDAPVPVIVRNEDDSEALETSLMANTVRLPMHPVDQYEVFTRFAAQGRSDGEIAARFGIAERTVRQQRALGALAPPVRKAWRDGKISAEVARAFTIQPDRAAQEAAWAKLKGQVSKYGGLNDYTVRRELAADRPAKSSVSPVVLARYLAAGGTLVEDLFDEKSYLENGALFRRVVEEVRQETLAEARATLAGQGWAWVALDSDLPDEWRYRWERLRVDWPGPTDDEEARCDALLDQIDALDRSDDVDEDAREAEIARLEAEIEAIDDASRLAVYTPEMRARAGCAITILGEGGYRATYGIIRPSEDGTVDLEDAIDATEEDETGEDDGAYGRDDAAGDEEDAAEADPFAISGALTETITTAQTQAVATIVSNNPELALRLAVAALRTSSYASPAKLRIEDEALARPPTTSDFAKHWDTAQFASYGDILAQFAGMVAASLSLVKTHNDASRRSAMALVAALAPEDYLLWMREAFLADDYFKRASKATALAAIEEMHEAGCADGVAPEDVLAGMKKGDLAAAAAAAAKACGWLPPELRHPAYALLTPDQTRARLTGKDAAAEQSSEAA